MIHIEEILVMKKNLVVKVIIGGNMFDEKVNKPKDEQETVNIKKKYVLDEMTNDMVDEIAKYTYQYF